MQALALLWCLMAWPWSGQAMDGPPKVIATFSVLGDLVHHVGGSAVTLVTLVGPDGDAHTFEPTPGDGVALAEAALVVENGLGYEPWLDKLFTASGSKARRLVVTSGLTLWRGASTGHGDAHHAAHGEVDPHVWHDVAHVVHMVHTIRDALIQLRPAHADTYRAHAVRYIAELQQLDAWIQAHVQAVPRERRKLVTSHDTFGYFARRYGFHVLGTVLASFSTETADPSGAELAALANKVKATRVPAIFAENVHHPRLLKQLAAASGVRLAPPLYTDALGPPGSPGESYVKMMRYNVSTIVEALRP